MNEHGLILIIDDKLSEAEEFGNVLRAEGYEVAIAATAEAGLARARLENFDVVLTGLHLSGADEQRKQGLVIINEKADVLARRCSAWREHLPSH